MKKLMQVDLSSLAVPVETKKRVYKKRKVETPEEIEHPSTGGKSIKSFPVKEKKPPTEKQLAAREKLKLARAAKIEQLKAEKAKFDEELRLKEEEILKKKEELAEKRRLKREEKKALLPQKPIVQSTPGTTGTVEDLGPSIGETLKALESKEPVFRSGNENHVQEVVQVENVQEPPSPERESKPGQVPGAPKREYVQRFRSYPFGKPVPAKPRFR